MYKEIILMVYILTYQDAVRRATFRMIMIIVSSAQMFVIFLFVGIIEAMLNRLLLYDIEDGDIQDNTEVWFTYSNSSVWYAFFTILTMFPGANYPHFMVAAGKVKWWAKYMITFELFLNNMILINLIMGTLYFYYQNYYIKAFEKLAEDKKLYELVSRECNFCVQIHTDVLKYIVDKHIMNPKYDFNNDEKFMMLRIKFNDQEQFETKKNRKDNRDTWYYDKFGKYHHLIHHRAFHLIFLSIDLIVIAALIVILDWIMPEIHTLEKQLEVKEDEKSRRKMTQYILYWRITLLIQVSLSFVSFLDCMFEITILGFHMLLQKKRSFLSFISTVLICCWGIAVLCMNQDIF